MSKFKFFNTKFVISNYKCLVIGVSAGGTSALTKLFSLIPANFPIPIIVAQHLHPNQSNFFIQFFNNKCALNIKEGADKQKIEKHHIYFAPPNYHLLVEDDYTFSLTVDSKLNYSRPSIDILFKTASCVYGSSLAGMILTGANSDGAIGLKEIKDRGGYTIVQEPKDAEIASMPKAAINETKVDQILTLSEIGQLLINVCK